MKKLKNLMRYTSLIILTIVIVTGIVTILFFFHDNILYRERVFSLLVLLLSIQLTSIIYSFFLKVHDYYPTNKYSHLSKICKEIDYMDIDSLGVLEVTLKRKLDSIKTKPHE